MLLSKFLSQGPWLSLLLLASTALQAGPEQAKTFSLGGIAQIEQILPLKQYVGEASALRMLVNPPLLYSQSDGRIVCLLCKESPEISLRRNEKKNITEQIVTLVLKKKLSWGDGHELTREDIKYTLFAMAAADYPEGQKPILPIARVEMDSKQPNKITLVLRHRRPDAAQLFAISLLPKHKSVELEQLIKSGGGEAQLLKMLTDPAYYYGSYRVAEASPQLLRLTPQNKNDWENVGEQELAVKLYPDIPSLARGLEKGEVDQTFNQAISWNEYQQLRTLVPRFNELYQARFDSGQNLEVMLLNMRSPLLINPAMRIALYRTINRDAINAANFENSGLKAEGFLHPDLVPRTGEKFDPAYMPENAAQILDQTGWTKAADGWRYNEKGQKLSLTLSCSESRLRLGWHKNVQSDLKEIGIEMQIESLPDESYLRQTLSHLRFKDAACIRWKMPPLSPPIQLFHSLAIPSDENGYTGMNFSGWEHTSVDRILETQMREHEVPHLIRSLGRLERQFQSDVPAIPLLYLPEITLSRKLPDPESLSMQKTLATYPTGGERSKSRL